MPGAARAVAPGMATMAGRGQFNTFQRSWLWFMLQSHTLSLDIEPAQSQTGARAAIMLNSFYAQWRVRGGIVSILQEDLESPPERLLQAVWHHQRVLRDKLETLDGRSVRILHPGFPNREGGPDFKSAVVQFGEDSPVSGDIEVDLRSSGWRSHGHDRNPAFQNVVLHVIWENERILGEVPPTLVLRGNLDAPLGELSLWLGSEAVQELPEDQRGKCCAPLRQLSRDQVSNLLLQAAHVRLRSKAGQFHARARQVGWEQSLWEGVFRALGYKHNSWPMQRLAELRPRWLRTADDGHQVSEASPTRPAGFKVQSRLLGLSGLLPVELTRSHSATDTYLRRVWDSWWRERDEFSDVILPRSLWRLHGLRPANHPQRRLALAAAWAVTNSLTERLDHWCTQELSPGGLNTALLKVLQVDSDEFWCWHWTLDSARLEKEQPLLGAARVTDLAVNVVLPWLWSRALEGQNEPVRSRLEQRYFDWPAAEDNSVLRLARQRLLGGSAPGITHGAASQQGLIQITRDFCDHSNATCERCKLPELVRDLRGL